MKKVLFILALIITATVSAQDLTREMTIAIKNDSPRDLKVLVNDTNKNQCLQAGTEKATILQLAVQMQRGDVVHYLINEAKVDVDQACNNNTPLMWAAKAGSSGLVASLLEAGADASIQVDGKTAKTLANESGNQATINLFR
jgi:ankyrin repeat protein